MKLPSSLFSIRWMWLGFAVMTFLLGWQLKVTHDTVIERISDDADNLVQSLDGHIVSSLRRLDSDLQQIADRLPQEIFRANAPQQAGSITRLLNVYRYRFPEAGNFFIANAQGDVLYSTILGSSGASVADRPEFQFLKNDSTARITFSDLRYGMRTNQPILTAYLPVRDDHDNLVGVVAGALNLDFYKRIFSSLNIPQGSYIYMRNSHNHKLLLRHPVANEADFNQPVQNQLQARVDMGETRGRDRFAAALDGTPRVYSFRKLEGYPFYIVVGLSEPGALAGWRRDTSFVMAGVLSTAILLIFLLRRMDRAQAQLAEARRKADEAAELLRGAVDSIAVGIAIYDSQDRQVMTNKAMNGMYGNKLDFNQPGVKFEDLMRQGLGFLLFPEAIGREEAWLRERMSRRNAGEGLSYELQLSDGRWMQYNEHLTPNGFRVGTRMDITERKRLEEELRAQASTDALTGLPNRRHFMSKLEEERERVRRRTTREACVLMLDLDHFKRVNDQYGHAAGDALLKHFASLLEEELRSTDSVGRLGGEEFAVILPGSGKEAAKVFAERLIEALAEHPLAWGAQQIKATVSIGIAALSPDDGAADAALSRADTALYRAKENGRNRVELAT